jgi:opacity protein-like surface antigen
MHNIKLSDAIGRSEQGSLRSYIACIIGLFLTADVEAVEYTFQADAIVGQEYNTNLFLTPGPHTDVWGTRLGLNTQFSAAEEIWKLDGKVRLDNYFYNQKGLDTLNQFVSLTGSYFTNERSQFAFRGEYIRDSTRTSFIETDDLVFNQVRRNSQLLNPSWIYDLSETTSLKLNYQYQNTEYKNTENTFFPHYQTHSGSIGVIHDYSERLQLNSSLSYVTYLSPGSTTVIPGMLDVLNLGIPGTYENQSDDIKIEYITAMAGFSYAVDETFKINLAGGGQYNITQYNIQTIFRDILGNPISVSAQHINNDSLTYVINAGATKSFELDDLNLNFTHTAYPDIYGNFIEADTVTFSNKHKFTPKLNGLIQLYYADRTTVDQRNIAFNHQLFRVQSDLIWNWTENWSITASYQYSRQEIDIISNIPESHAAFLTIRYQWDKLQY